MFSFDVCFCYIIIRDFCDRNDSCFYPCVEQEKVQTVTNNAPVACAFSWRDHQEEELFVGVHMSGTEASEGWLRSGRCGSRTVGGQGSEQHWNRKQLLCDGAKEQTKHRAEESTNLPLKRATGSALCLTVQN